MERQTNIQDGKIKLNNNNKVALLCLIDFDSKNRIIKELEIPQGIISSIDLNSYCVKQMFIDNKIEDLQQSKIKGYPDFKIDDWFLEVKSVNDTIRLDQLDFLLKSNNSKLLIIKTNFKIEMGNIMNILKELYNNSGSLTVFDLAFRINVHTNTIRNLMYNLLDNGLVKTVATRTGKTRCKHYYAITQEGIEKWEKFIGN